MVVAVKTPRMIVDIFDDSRPEAKRRFTAFDCVPRPIGYESKNQKHIEVFEPVEHWCRHGVFDGKDRDGWHHCDACQNEADLQEEW